MKYELTWKFVIINIIVNYKLAVNKIYDNSILLLRTLLVNLLDFFCNF